VRAVRSGKKGGHESWPREEGTASTRYSETKERIFIRFYKREARSLSRLDTARSPCADRFHISHHLRERAQLDAQGADVQGAGWWQSTSYRVRCIESRNEMIAK
jgi:hypothetical protein